MKTRRINDRDGLMDWLAEQVTETEPMVDTPTAITEVFRSLVACLRDHGSVQDFQLTSILMEACLSHSVGVGKAAEQLPVLVEEWITSMLDLDEDDGLEFFVALVSKRVLGSQLIIARRKNGWRLGSTPALTRARNVRIDVVMSGKGLGTPKAVRDGTVRYYDDLDRRISPASSLMMKFQR